MERHMSTCRMVVFALALASAAVLVAPVRAQSEVFEQGSWNIQFSAGYVQKNDWGPGVPDFQLVPLNARLGYMLMSPSDWDWAGPFNGNWEALLEMAVDPGVDTFANIVVGPSLLLRYNNTGFCDGIHPYAQFGAGFVYTDGYRDMTQRALGQGGEFYLQAGVGVRWLFDSCWSIETGLEYLHISNAGMADRNGGLNCLGFSVGVTYHFGPR
jgi:opacity protein-like surface antigen